MKFDNAFKTVNGKVGLQYKDKDKILTVYPDKEGVLQVSEEASAQQAEQLISNHNKFAHRYG